MSSNVLTDRDINEQPVHVADADGKLDNTKAEVKSMEYHRQVLQSKIDDGAAQQSYVSPSDNIMSPCTAKLSAYRNKNVMKTKPKSLFAKTSSKNVDANTKNGEMFRDLGATQDN